MKEEIEDVSPDKVFAVVHIGKCIYIYAAYCIYVLMYKVVVSSKSHRMT